jgi:hypothetical protein
VGHALLRVFFHARPSEDRRRAPRRRLTWLSSMMGGGVGLGRAEGGSEIVCDTCAYTFLNTTTDYHTERKHVFLVSRLYSYICRTSFVSVQWCQLPPSTFRFLHGHPSTMLRAGRPSSQFTSAGLPTSKLAKRNETVCVCVCVCARARVHVCVCVCARAVCGLITESTQVGVSAFLETLC